MKLCNIIVDGAVNLALVTDKGVVDATAAGCKLTMDQVIAGADRTELSKLAADDTLPVVQNPVYANVVNNIGKLVCIGLNYMDHAKGASMKIPEYPILFSKFANALVPTDTDVLLPAWEKSYDYEAELVIIMGKTAWDISEEEAMDYVFGYTCGNDLSCREAQMRSGQWLIGKSLPGFGPCGPCIVTADDYDPNGKAIKSYVNGEIKQNGNTADMIFNCAKIISYASKYVQLEPGDMIFTGTPSGVELEKGENACWLKPGDNVVIEIEGIGSLVNNMC